MCKIELILRQLFLAGFICLGMSNSYSQEENPWKTIKKENPWKTETNESSKKDTTGINPTQEKTVIVQKAQHAVPNSDTITLETKPSQQIVVKRTNVYEIEDRAKNEYKAGAAFGASVATGFLLNIFSLPINLTSVFVPTYQEKRMIAEFKEDNPEASKYEVKAVKRGIRKKRGKNTAGGTAVGLGMFAGLIFLLSR